jgi:hypothetical protein
MIDVYDKNTISGLLQIIYPLADEKGIELNGIGQLDYSEAKKVIINPISDVFVGHWKKIGSYIKENPEKQFYLFTPNNSPVEVENLIGKYENVEYLIQGINIDYGKFEKLMEEELK